MPLTLADGRDVEVQRVRNPRARRLKLSVDERGARLTVPPRTSLVAGERFLIEHRDWLSAQLDHYADVAPPPLQQDVTAALPLRGAEQPLTWQRGRFAKVQDDGGQLVFVAPGNARQASLQRALRDFYESRR